MEEAEGDGESIDEINLMIKNAAGTESIQEHRGVATQSQSVAPQETQQKNMPMTMSYKQGQWSPSCPEGNKIYELDFLLALKNAPCSLIKPSNLPGVLLNNSNNRKTQNVAPPKTLDDMKIELSYKKGQWSPSCPEGNKIYEVEFLMALKRAPCSLIKPSNLPDVLLYDSNNRQRYPEIHYKSEYGMFPGFGRNFSMERSQSITEHSSLSGKVNNDSGTLTNKISISLKEDIKLHETENAWKPSRLAKIDTRTEDEKKSEDLYKKIRSVLNKLMPQKFDTLLKQIKDLKIETVEHLEGVTNLIFEKAIREPKFSAAYAKMCKELSKINVNTGQGGQAVFKPILINRCQEEFEKQSKDEHRTNEKKTEIEQCEDAVKKKELEFELEEFHRRVQLKALGNIKFIGELFKIEMLTPNIMLSCLNKLLSNKDEDSLECLCILLSTIGKALEDGKDGKDLTKFFNIMQDIVDKKQPGCKVSSRIRFMLQDVIDLRRSKWVPRRQYTNPKTIDQIVSEAENEQINQSLTSKSGMLSENFLLKNWITPRNLPFVQKEKLKMRTFGDDEPFGVSHMFQTWGKDNQFRGGSSNNTGLTNATNKYAILENSTSAGSAGPQQAQLEDETTPSETLRHAQIEEATNFEGEQSEDDEEQDHDIGIWERILYCKKTCAEMDLYDIEENEEYFQTLFINYIEGEFTLKESYYFVIMRYHAERRRTKSWYIWNEITAYDFHDCYSWAKFIRDGHNIALDYSSDRARYKIGLLYAKLIEKNIISRHCYIKNLPFALHNIDNRRSKSNNLWDHCAQMVVPLIYKEILSLRDLLSSIHSSRPYIEKFIKSLFNTLKSQMGYEWLKYLWKDTYLKFSFIISPERVYKFVHENNFWFLVQPHEKIENNKTYSNDIDYQFLEFFYARTPVDLIKNWIKIQVMDKNILLRGLVKAKYQYSLTIDEQNLNKYNGLIEDYVADKKIYKAHRIYALHAFIKYLEYNIDSPGDESKEGNLNLVEAKSDISGELGDVHKSERMRKKTNEKEKEDLIGFKLSVEERLLEFFNDNVPIDQIKVWISKKLQDGMEDYLLVRAIGKAKYKYSISVDREEFSRYNELFEDLICDNQTYQLHCIYALNSLLNGFEHDLDLPNDSKTPYIRKVFKETEVETYKESTDSSPALQEGPEIDDHDDQDEDQNNYENMEYPYDDFPDEYIYHIAGTEELDLHLPTEFENWNEHANSPMQKHRGVVAQSQSVATAETHQKNMPMKMSYKHGQWSPDFPEGEKIYDLDFLLALKNSPNSMVKPANLPDFILRKSNNAGEVKQSRMPTNTDSWTMRRTTPFAMKKDTLKIKTFGDDESFGGSHMFQTWGKGTQFKGPSTNTTVLTNTTNKYVLLENAQYDGDKKSGGYKKHNIGGYSSTGYSLERSNYGSKYGGYDSRSGSQYRTLNNDQQQYQQQVQSSLMQDNNQSMTSSSMQRAQNCITKHNSSCGKVNNNIGTLTNKISLSSKEHMEQHFQQRVQSYLMQNNNRSMTSSSMQRAQAPASATPTLQRGVAALSQQQQQQQQGNVVAASMTEEQMERFLKNILEEYINDNCTFEECDEDIAAKIPVHYMTRMVSYEFLSILKKFEKARLKTGLLFAKLIKSGTLPLNAYCAGLEEIFIQIEDLIIDIPMIWKYLAQIIAPAICEESLPLDRLRETSDILIKNKMADELIAPTFRLIVSEKGPNFLRDLWRGSRVQFEDFVAPQIVDAFVAENKLEFLNGAEPRQGDSHLNYEQIETKLLEFFESGASFDDVNNWITTNVGEKTKERQFVRTLATAIYKYAIANGKLQKEKLTLNYKLFHKYVDSHQPYELQCLYALQSLVDKMEHPQGLSVSIFNQLSKDMIISRKSFIAWEVSKDPAEQGGEGETFRLTGQNYVPRNNQAVNQGAGLRGIPQTGPPNQAPTPPNQDLKVEQQPPMNLYQLQNQMRQPQYFRQLGPQQTNQPPRWLNNQHRVAGQQQMYQKNPQYVQMPTGMYPLVLYAGHQRQNYVQQPPVLLPSHSYPYTFQQQALTQTQPAVAFFLDQYIPQRAPRPGPPPPPASTLSNQSAAVGGHVYDANDDATAEKETERYLHH